MPNPEKAGSLYVKSYFAPSVLAAMQQARRELGADALLLNSREAPPEARHLGEYEVIFGTLPGTAVPAPAAAIPVTTSRADELRQRIREIRELIDANKSSAPSHAAERPAVEVGVAQAIECGTSKRLAKGAVLDIARARADREPEDPCPTPFRGNVATPSQSAAADDLRGHFDVQPEIGRITVLVGPPGSGKTTTLVKLAVNECLKQGRAVRFLSADTVRIGGAYQLRTYAAILGVPFQAVESTTALEQAIDATPDNTFLLIDTPGFSAALQEELGSELATFLRHRQDIDTQLVLTASMAPADLQSTVDRFAPFNPAKLIFTRLDETTSTAAVISEAARTRRPVSFLCNGQSVPEDIRPASKDLLISSLVRQLPDSLQAVA